VTSWFIKHKEDTEETGPYKPAELLEMVRKGEVVRETFVRKDDSAWFIAMNVGGLFEAAMRPTIQYFCPQCSVEVGEPPVICHHCGRDIREGIVKITEHGIVEKSNQSLASSAGSSVKRWLKKKRKSEE
jgi:GYF domain 2